MPTNEEAGNRTTAEARSGENCLLNKPPANLALCCRSFPRARWPLPRLKGCWWKKCSRSWYRPWWTAALQVTRFFFFFFVCSLLLRRALNGVYDLPVNFARQIRGALPTGWRECSLSALPARDSLFTARRRCPDPITQRELLWSGCVCHGTCNRHTQATPALNENNVCPRST